MKNNIFSSIATKAIVSMAFVVFIACERDDADLGLPYVDDNQLSFGEMEMTPIITYTTAFDSIRSNNPVSGIGLVGGYTDPVMGRHDAKVTSHLLPGGVPSFGTNPVCDSAFLFLPFTVTSSAWLGDTTQPFHVYIHTLRNFLDPDSSYYSNRNFPVDKLIADAIIEARPRTPRDYDHLNTARPVVKIPVDPSFIEDDLFVLEGTSAFETTKNFISQFYGIQISSDQNAEAILGLLLPSTDTKLRMYFRNDEQDTAHYDLRMGSAGEFVNTFEHDYSTAAFDLDNQDRVNGESTTYSQTMSGVVTAIEVPDMAFYQDSGWLLNRAELLLPVQAGSALSVRLPERLQIVVDDTSGRKVIFDYLSEGTARVGGALTTGELRDHKYRFVITRQMQRFLDNKDLVTRFLVVPESSSSDQSRTVLNGNTSPLEPAELKLYYTRTK